ncbi:MAG: N-6 DNA methylase [Chloroflexi bacterium]|nr:N-6 DNA methylase [Chloroflexota bacterium]
MSAIRDYLTEIQSEFNTGMAGEHAYRPALKKLLESIDTGLNAVNDPARTAIGMPDFVVLRQPGNVPIGIVEAKDIGNQLSRTEKSDQIKRYMAQGNLILTNYLEFRWYVNGERVGIVEIAREKDGKITRVSKTYGDLTDMLSQFALQTAPTVNSARELAERLARHAKLIAHFIEKDLKSDEPSKHFQDQKSAFANTLIPDLDEEKFADMYAQTLTYGLFASRVNYPANPAQFSLSGAAEDIPRTNPFLRRLFHHSSFDLGSRLTWLVESLVEILRHTDMDSILEHFGKQTQQTDPDFHFYETFLSAYNPGLRDKRGVYYTPESVVKYIVRSVDHILKTCFDRPDGLADKDTLILDPAVGTGTFLYFVIEQIYDSFLAQRGRWKSYVDEHLLPRLFGFELLMAPYTVAHMKLSMQLDSYAYEFREDQRLGIYLTNSLEEGIKEKYESPFGGFLEQEANEATAIKREKPIMVILGNPPYRGHSVNKGEWITNLLNDYAVSNGNVRRERNTKWIKNDYVKFIRFGQWRIEQTGSGVLAFITANSYLDALTFRGMRKHLLEACSSIYVVNLHGSTKRKSRLDGKDDENVFEIQSGVSILFLTKEKSTDGMAAVHYCDIRGTRDNKYAWLNEHDISNSPWTLLNPSSPNYFFVQQDTTFRYEYERYTALTDIVIEHVTGFQTHRDHFAVDFDREEIVDRAKSMRDRSVSDSWIREAYSLHDTKDWQVQNARMQIVNDDKWEEKITVCSYRPFDDRHCYLSTAMMDRPRRKLLDYVLNKENLCLLATRQQGTTGFRHIWLTDYPANDCVISNKSREANAVFPVYTYPNRQKELADTSEYPLSEKGRRPNLSRAFVSEMELNLGLQFITEGSAFADSTVAANWFGTEDVFYYAYAVFHSPTYRERYAEFLKIDFPRLPLTSDIDLFVKLVRLGAELARLHLMNSPKLLKPMTTYNVAVDDKSFDNLVSETGDFPKYVEKGGQVYINEYQYIGDVPQEIWDFHIGGYQVLHKWLEDRRGRVLSTDDLEHYQKIIVALSETIRIMQEIDEAIPQFPIE